jgi:hypothetical protein
MIIRPRHSDDAMNAVIDGSVPTADEFAVIRSRRLPVHVLEMPNGWQDLSFLHPIASELADLTVTTMDCKDAREVEKMRSLHRLALWIDAQTDVELGELPLKSFGGPWKHFSSATRCSSLEELFLTSPDADGLGALQSSLRSLTLTSAAKLAAIPSIEHTDRLHQLTIHGARRLDLSGLAWYHDLQSIHFESCRALESVQTLLSLPALEYVYLESCPQVEDYESLKELKASQIKIVGKNPFDARFRAEVGDRGTWSFPPGKD